MNRTITALYETREQAERARQAVLSAHLSKEEDVEIRDHTHADAKQHHSGLGGWLSDLFRGHEDHHLFAEGLRRGHFLLSAKVDDLNEARAAVLMDDAAMNLTTAEKTWRSEGWSPAAQGQAQTVSVAETRSALEIGAEPDRGPYAEAPGSSVRAYTL